MAPAQERWLTEDHLSSQQRIFNARVIAEGKLSTMVSTCSGNSSPEQIHSSDTSSAAYEDDSSRLDPEGTKKKARFCKGKRDRLRKLIIKLSANYSEDPERFDIDAQDLPPSVKDNTELKEKIMKAVQMSSNTIPQSCRQPEFTTTELRPHAQVPYRPHIPKVVPQSNMFGRMDMQPPTYLCGLRDDRFRTAESGLVPPWIGQDRMQFRLCEGVAYVR